VHDGTVCLPQVSTRQLVDMVMAYLRAHPESRIYSAASIGDVAFTQAFPCVSKRRPPVEIFFARCGSQLAPRTWNDQSIEFGSAITGYDRRVSNLGVRFCHGRTAAVVGEPSLRPRAQALWAQSFASARMRRGGGEISPSCRSY